MKTSSGHKSAMLCPIDLCLVLGWGFSKDRLAVFKLTAHELHELYYDTPTAQRGIGQTPCSFEHVSCEWRFTNIRCIVCHDVF